LKKKVSDIAAAVLAGGMNSRMAGQNKCFIEIYGKPIISRTVELLGGIFEEVILATNSPQEYKSYKKTVVMVGDIIKGAGPLSGIHSVLSVAKEEAVFFVACDMPFLHNEMIRRQLEYFKTKNCGALVPKVGNFIEPLHAIYKNNLAVDIRRFVKEGSNYSIRSFLKTVNVCYWHLEENPFHRNIFKNINTEEDARAVRDGIIYGH